MCGNDSRAETIWGYTVWKLPRWPTFLRWNLSHANGWQCGKPFHGHRRINLAHDCSLSTHGIRRMLTRWGREKKKVKFYDILYQIMTSQFTPLHVFTREKKMWIHKNSLNNQISESIICHNDELSWLFTNRASAIKHMKVKRMGITEILRRIWLFSLIKIKSSESFNKQPTQLIIEFNSSLRQIIDSQALLVYFFLSKL